MKTRRFSTTLVRHQGVANGWVFATIPAAHAPPVTRGWGRTPVRATVDGHTWNTSVWRSKNGSSVLAVPKHVRGGKGDGDKVRVEITFDPED